MANDGLAAVGERDVVLALGAVGMRAIAAETKEQIQSAVHRLAADGVPVIFITEKAARLVPETLEKYRTSARPVLIPVPGAAGTDGFGIARVTANIEKAIGADLPLTNSDA